MNGRALYNEIEPFSATRARVRVAAGLVCPGDVDERDIRDIAPVELEPYDQVHLFAGGGAWSYALRLAGWPDDRSTWTVSCPCQPFSSAGRRSGTADERHLWPAAFHLIDHRRPDVVFGEQVASKDGLAWFDLVRADLEGAGYAIRVQDTCSAGVGAPNIRQRLYFAAERLGDADGPGPQGRGGGRHGSDQRASGPGGLALGLAGTDGRERDGRTDATTGHDGRGANAGWPQGDGGPAACCDVGVVAGAARELNDGRRISGSGGRFESSDCGAPDRPGPTNGFWRDADWLFCRDDRWRPVEPGLEPLVAGLSDRVGRRLRVGQLREHGNAINVQVAAGFISDFLDDCGG